MEIKKVASRGTLFTFHDLGIATNIYVINAKKNIYIIDTYLGPEIMEPIKTYINENWGEKSIILINSHSHWDHIWGNCSFESSLILSHIKCKENMEKEAAIKLEKFKDYHKGEIILTYPNLTFTDRICFEEDNLLIYHSPGHSDDEITIFDKEDMVLFVGDNLERPIPYIMYKDLNQYIDTLEDYLKMDAEIIIGGHTACENKKLIEDNLAYIKKVVSGEMIEISSEDFAAYHKTNLEWLKQHKFDE